MGKYEYGAGSSKFELEADNKLTAYATICLHYRNQPHLVVIYKPDDCDSWFSIDGKCADRLDDIFGGKGSFDVYMENNIEEIKKSYQTIKRLV